MDLFKVKTTLSLTIFVLLVICSSQGLSNFLGTLSKDDILQNFPSWREEADSYSPSIQTIHELNGLDYPVKIEIFLGTWCPDSKQHVSAYFKIMEMADNPLLTTTYIGIPRDKEDRKSYIQGKNIIRVPTFIVYIHGHEQGRIIEHPKKSVEEDLMDIIQGSPDQ
ncbi:MAG: thioredoxin family protein [Candidatus Aminicenantes bacterium]